MVHEEYQERAQNHIADSGILVSRRTLEVASNVNLCAILQCHSSNVLPLLSGSCIQRYLSALRGSQYEVYCEQSLYYEYGPASTQLEEGHDRINEKLKTG